MTSTPPRRRERISSTFPQKPLNIRLIYVTSRLMCLGASGALCLLTAPTLFLVPLGINRGPREPVRVRVYARWGTLVPPGYHFNITLAAPLGRHNISCQAPLLPARPLHADTHTSEPPEGAEGVLHDVEREIPKEGPRAQGILRTQEREGRKAKD